MHFERWSMVRHFCGQVFLKIVGAQIPFFLQGTSPSHFSECDCDYYGQNKYIHKRENAYGATSFGFQLFLKITFSSVWALCGGHFEQLWEHFTFPGPISDKIRFSMILYTRRFQAPCEIPLGGHFQIWFRTVFGKKQR